jgi:hypothetical protein
MNIDREIIVTCIAECDEMGLNTCGVVNGSVGIVIR